MGMPEHKLESGKSLIKGIVDLGEVLGYHVDQEFPVEPDKKGNKSTIDVAWFSKQGHLYPLFIFEVESSATGGMAYNPLKVYAKKNQVFEKPLFYFHVLLKGGLHSSKIDDLESQYGSNNYRLYLVGEDSANTLVNDVLSQHARIRDDISYYCLYEVLSSPPWQDKVDYVPLLKHAESLGLSKETAIASYINLTRADRCFLEDLVQLLDIDAEDNFVNTKLDTYIGSQWFVPVLCSMNIGLSSKGKDIDKWSNRILKWQNESSFMPMITPALGRSLDYDTFILGCAPQLITLSVGLSAGKGNFYFDFIEVFENVIDKIGVCSEGLNTAIYLLHISARLGLDETYKKAKKYLHEFGTISITDVYEPPSIVLLMEGDFEDFFHYGDNVSIPSMEKFSEICIEKYRTEEYKDKYNIVDVALKSLADDSYIYEWSKDILSFLWSTTAK